MKYYEPIPTSHPAFQKFFLDIFQFAEGLSKNLAPSSDLEEQAKAESLRVTLMATSCRRAKSDHFRPETSNVNNDRVTVRAAHDSSPEKLGVDSFDIDLECLAGAPLIAALDQQGRLPPGKALLDRELKRFFRLGFLANGNDD